MTEIHLTGQAQALLTAIRTARGEWLTRSDILRVIGTPGKKRLNKWDTKLLNDLIEAGLVETRKQPIKSPIGYEWRYRAREQSE